MKYLIWVSVFAGFLLSCFGIFTLIGNVTRGVTVQREEAMVLMGNTVMVPREVEFNELPEVVMTLGMAGLFITMAVSYGCANAIINSWDSYDEKVITKPERLMRIGIFIVCFLVFSFIFGVHQVSDILTIPGYIFIILTCTSSILASNLLSKIYFQKHKTSESTGNEEVSV